MSQWDKLFQQKLKEVMHHKHRDYEYASLSPTASGNVARALIAEEYSAQADRIAELEKQELNDGCEPVKNATYWKRQYNLMASQNDNLKSGLYHANEQIKYLESHPVKELTDEEIEDLMVRSGFIMHDFYSVKIFVESVLRKAQEK